MFGSYDFDHNEFAGHPITHAGTFSDCMVIRRGDGSEPMSTRLTNFALMDGVQLKFKYQLPENNTITSGSETVVLNYCITRFTDDWQVTTGFDANEPGIKDIIPFYPFGFVRQLDVTQEQLGARFRKKNLIKGQLTIKPSELHNQSGIITRYYKFKNPLMVQYSSSENEGDWKPLKYKFFLAMRSNYNESGTDASYQPVITACVKTYWHEPT